MDRLEEIRALLATAIPDPVTGVHLHFEGPVSIGGTKPQSKKMEITVRILMGAIGGGLLVYGGLRLQAREGGLAEVLAGISLIALALLAW